MKYIVSLSGGVASAVAADRALQKYGDDVLLWFADTKWEDEDLYRFLDDLEKHWNRKIIRQADGRQPLQVAEDKGLIFNQARAYCSFVLKSDLFSAYLETIEKPVTIMFGFDGTEGDRIERTEKRYQEEGIYFDHPLTWKPYDFYPFETVKSWGIEIPRLYKMGYSHNNCGGRCVKGGKAYWRMTKINFPERFAEVRDWEQMMIQRGIDENKAMKDYAILREQTGGELKPLTLAEFEENMGEQEEGKYTQEDLFTCYCGF